MNYCYKDYIELNPDISHLNESDAETHWIKEGFPAMRLCNRAQLIVRCEFGAELILYACYYHYLYKAGLLFDNKITTYKGMKDFYYFIKPENIIEKEESRVHGFKQPFLVNNTEHVQRFDMRYWVPPPYKRHFQNTKFVYDKPLLIIQNKYNIEWGKYPINFFSVDVLDSMFSTLKDKYTIVYICPSSKLTQPAYGFSIDHNDMVDGLKDFELIETKYKDSVIVFEDLLSSRNMTYNRLKLELFSCCENYISVQGGNTYLNVFFFKTMLILHKAGSETGSGAYTGWYLDANPIDDKVCKICHTDESLLSSLPMFL